MEEITRHKPVLREFLEWQDYPAIMNFCLSDVRACKQWPSWTHEIIQRKRVEFFEWFSNLTWKQVVDYCEKRPEVCKIRTVHQIIRVINAVPIWDYPFDERVKSLYVTLGDLRNCDAEMKVYPIKYHLDFIGYITGAWVLERGKLYTFPEFENILSNGIPPLPIIKCKTFKVYDRRGVRRITLYLDSEITGLEKGVWARVGKDGKITKDHVMKSRRKYIPDDFEISIESLPDSTPIGIGNIEGKVLNINDPRLPEMIIDNPPNDWDRVVQLLE